MPDLPGRERYFQTRGLTPERLTWRDFLNAEVSDSFSDGPHTDQREGRSWKIWRFVTEEWSERYGVTRDGRGVWSDSRDK